MSIKAVLPTGKVHSLDLVPDKVSRLSFVCVFLNAAQMRRLFTGSDASDVARELGLDASGSERAICERIEAHYAG